MRKKIDKPSLAIIVLDVRRHPRKKKEHTAMLVLTTKKAS